MGRLGLGINAFDAAVQRLTALYLAGDRVVVALSGGKDSTVCLELAILAARETVIDVNSADDRRLLPGEEP